MPRALARARDEGMFGSDTGILIETGPLETITIYHHVGPKDFVASLFEGLSTP